MQLDGNIEENVLALLCFSEQHAYTVALEVPTDLFSTRVYKVIADAAVKYLAKYNKPPQAHLRDILERRINRGDEGKVILNTINMMMEMYPSMNPTFMAEEVTNFVRKQRITQAAIKMSELVEQGDLDKAEEVFNESRPAAASMTVGTWAHDSTKMLSFLDKSEDNTFSSGIEVLDERDIRPTRKTLTVLIAPPKAGKSWYLVNVGKANLMAGKRVLHITLENSEELTAKRYVQSFYAMTKSEIKDLTVPVFERDEFGRVTEINLEELTGIKTINDRTRLSVAKKLEKLKRRPRLLIKEFATGTLSISGLLSYLTFLEREHGFVPDILVYDYLNLTQKKGVDIRQELGMITIGLRGIAVTRNLAMVTATQGNRSSSKSKIVDKDQVGEDWSIIFTADTVLTYTKTPMEKRAGLGRVYVGAARDSEDEFVILLAQSYATGQFSLDSTYLTNKVQRAAAEVTGEDTNEPK